MPPSSLMRLRTGNCRVPGSCRSAELPTERRFDRKLRLSVLADDAEQAIVVVACRKEDDSGPISRRQRHILLFPSAGQRDQHRSSCRSSPSLDDDGSTPWRRARCDPIHRRPLILADWTRGRSVPTPTAHRANASWSPTPSQPASTKRTRSLPAHSDLAGDFRMCPSDVSRASPARSAWTGLVNMRSVCALLQAGCVRLESSHTSIQPE